jgi:hypothetical protein
LWRSQTIVGVWVWRKDMMRIAALIVALAAAGAAFGTPYWIAYEGHDFPENEGWLRVWGDEEGPYHGGAERSLADGILTLDGLRSDQIYDFYEMQRPIAPGPGETFVAEWRVLVDPASDPRDVGVAIANPSRLAFFLIGPNSLVSWDGPAISIEAGVFHTFVFSSQNMQEYQLVIDDDATYNGYFNLPTYSSFVNFGDAGQGERSSSQWDYFRFGVVPEPASALLAGCTFSFSRRTRRCYA